MFEDTEQFLEILALTNPKGVDLQSAGRSTKPGITPDDINAALAGVDAVGATIIKRKYQGASDHDDGFSVLYARLIRRLDSSGWKDVDKALAKGRVRLLLGVVLDDLCKSYHCRVCHGMGKVKESEESIVLRTCRSCKGERFKPRLDKDRAEILGVTPVEYSKVWRYRYKWVSDFLTDTVCIANHEANAREQLRRNLR